MKIIIDCAFINCSNYWSSRYFAHFSTADWTNSCWNKVNYKTKKTCTLNLSVMVCKSKILQQATHFSKCSTLRFEYTHYRCGSWTETKYDKIGQNPKCLQVTSLKSFETGLDSLRLGVVLVVNIIITLQPREKSLRRMHISTTWLKLP